MCTGVQVNLALCCKAMLRILFMGHVAVGPSANAKRPLLKITRGLSDQPSGVTHLDI